MSLSRSQVHTLAHLARIELSDADLDAYQHSLSAVLALVDQLQAVDTQGVEPLTHPLDAHQPLRIDTVEGVIEPERYQYLAPQAAEGLYWVPRVIE